MFCLKSGFAWATWVAQLVKRLTLAHVMISWFVGSSPTLSSMPTAQSLEPALDSVSSLCLSPVHTRARAHALSLSNINKHFKKSGFALLYLHQDIMHQNNGKVVFPKGWNTVKSLNAALKAACGRDFLILTPARNHWGMGVEVGQTLASWPPAFLLIPRVLLLCSCCGWYSWGTLSDPWPPAPQQQINHQC